MAMAKLFKLLLLVLGVSALVEARQRFVPQDNDGKPARFDGYKVFRLRPENDDQMRLLRSLEASSDYDFWTSPNQSGLPVDVMVAPEDQRAFTELMHEYEIESEEIIDDVQSKIAQTRVAGSYNATRGMTWTEYHDLESIHEWMRQLPRQYPDVAEVLSVGESYERRDLKAIKISHGPGRKAVFIEGGIHAREWISPATVTYIINELLTSEDERVQTLARSFDWYLLPSLNPDGYVVTHTMFRLWRKNTKFNGKTCIGVDLNRNFDFHWGEEGESENPCAETYAGPNPFSETETSTLVYFLKKIGHRLVAYLSMHSYSQLLLIPYSNTSEHLANFDDTYDIGKVTVEALRRRHGTKYKVGNTAEILYPAFGTSDDYVKEKYDVPIAYTYELRDTGRDGFLLPPEQITPNCEEVMDSLIAMFGEAEKKNYFQLDRES